MSRFNRQRAIRYFPQIAQRARKLFIHLKRNKHSDPFAMYDLAYLKDLDKYPVSPTGMYEHRTIILFLRRLVRTNSFRKQLQWVIDKVYK